METVLGHGNGVDIGTDSEITAEHPYGVGAKVGARWDHLVPTF